MSDGHTGPGEKEDQTASGETNTQAASDQAAPAPGEQAVAEKRAPKKRAPRKPKAPSENPGAEISAAEKPAPRKVAQKPAEPPPPPPVQDEEQRSALRSPVVLWSLIGGAIIILAALGYVGWTKFGPHHTGDTATSALANRSVCQATLDRVLAYGVIPPAATLSQQEPDKTQANGRVTCHAQAGSEQFAITADVPCEDMGKDACIKIYSVKQADGTALFQRQM